MTDEETAIKLLQARIKPKKQHWILRLLSRLFRRNK